MQRLLWASSLRILVIIPLYSQSRSDTTSAKEGGSEERTPTSTPSRGLHVLRRTSDTAAGTEDLGNTIHTEKQKNRFAPAANVFRDTLNHCRHSDAEGDNAASLFE
jgi:hypothetical protein